MERLAQRWEEFAGRRYRLLQLSLLVALLVMGLPIALMSGVGEDESFYAMAAHRVWNGDHPYLDFMFPQAPLAAYVFAPAVGLLGIEGARLFSLLLGVAAVGLTMITAERLAGRGASLVAGLVLVTSFPFLAWAAGIAPFSLSALLVAASACVLVARIPRDAAFLMAGALLGLAASVRLNLGVAIPFLLVYAWLAHRSLRPTLAAALGAGVVLLAVYAPFLLADADATRWSVLTYQLMDERDPATGLASLLKYKADGVHHIVTAFPLVVPAFLFAGLFLTLRRKEILERHLMATYLGVAALAIVAVTFTKVYIQAHYVLPVLPLVAIVLGTLVARLHAALPTPLHRGTLAAWIAFALAVGLVAAAPPLVRNHAPASDPDVLRQAADVVAAHTASNETVLTFLPAVALLADRAPTPGAEMGAFAYYPNLPTDEARRAHVLNAERVLDLLARRDPAALVLKDDDFTSTPFPTAAQTPAEQDATLKEIRRLVDEGYRLEATLGDGALRIYVRA